jgi:dephospho-CoA kinase
MFSFGLTGGIGSGKSTALNCFKQLGWNVLNADSICHDIYDNSEKIKKKFIARWGLAILASDNSIDRKKISDIVFKKPEEIEWLNSQLHPEIFKIADIMINSLPDKSKVIFEVPLMYEVAWNVHFDKIILVYASKDIRQKRLIERGMTIEEIKLRFNAQMPLEDKLELSDYALINNGSLKFLEKQISTTFYSEK